LLHVSAPSSRRGFTASGLIRVNDSSTLKHSPEGASRMQGVAGHDMNGSQVGSVGQETLMLGEQRY
jgi:hypothetical protein